MKIESYTKEYLKKGNNHLYIEPDKELTHCIAHYTITFKNIEKPVPEDSVLHIVPDLSGCIVIPMLNLNNINIWGPMTKAVTLKNDLNTAECRFFIEFLPGGIYSFISNPLDVFVDEQMQLQVILPELNKQLVNIVETTTNYDALVEKINIVCKEQIQKNQEDQVYRKFIKIVQDDSFTIKTLSEKFKVSERQVHRYFKKYIGIPYSTYKKIKNINQLLPTILDSRLTNVAYDNNYFDQAHFNHAFKEICKTTPTKYIDNLSSFYNEIYKF